MNPDLTKSPKSESTALVQQPLFQVYLGQLLGSSSSFCSRREPLRTSGMGFYRRDTISVKTLKETRMTQPRSFFIHHWTPEGRGRAPFRAMSHLRFCRATLTRDKIAGVTWHLRRLATNPPKVTHWRLIGENFYTPDLLDTNSVGQQMVSVHWKELKSTDSNHTVFTPQKEHWRHASIHDKQCNRWSKYFNTEVTMALHMDGSTIFLGCAWREPPSNTWFLGPTPVHIPNSISIGSAVFAHLTEFFSVYWHHLLADRMNIQQVRHVKVFSNCLQCVTYEGFVASRRKGSKASSLRSSVVNEGRTRLDHSCSLQCFVTDSVHPVNPIPLVRRGSLYRTMGHPFSPIKLPLHMGDADPIWWWLPSSDGVHISHFSQ